MTTVAERLKKAIQEMPRVGKERGVRRFQRVLAERYPHVTGTSYPSIYNYLNGKTVPPAEFLRAAADVLGVDLDWLASGKGEQTAEHAVVAAATAAGEHPEVEEAWEFALLVMEELGMNVTSTRMPYWAPPLLELWRRRSFSVRVLEEAYGGRTNPRSANDVAREIARALAAPIRELGLEKVSLQQGRRPKIEEYILAMIPALAHIVEYLPVPNEAPQA